MGHDFLDQPAHVGVVDHVEDPRAIATGSHQRARRSLARCWDTPAGWAPTNSANSLTDCSELSSAQMMRSRVSSPSSFSMPTADWNSSPDGTSAICVVTHIA